MKELEPQQIEQLEIFTKVNETQAKELHKVLGNIDTENILRFKKIPTPGDGNCFFNSLKQSFNSKYPDIRDNILNIYTVKDFRITQKEIGTAQKWMN